MVRTVFLPLFLIASASVAGCVRDPESTARTAFDQDLPLEIPSWVSTPAQQAAAPKPPRVYRTIELGATDADRRAPDPAAAPAMAAPAAPPPAAPATDEPPSAYGYYGYYGYYGDGGNHSAYAPHHTRTTSPSAPRSCSSPVTSPRPGDDWPAVRDYGPSFPFTWANPTR